jgi:acyl dehydratase
MVQSAARYFDDFAVGEKFRSTGATMTEGAMVDFALQWDPQPFHIDAEFSKTWAYGGLIASGMHTMCVSLRLWLAMGIFAHCNMGSPGLEQTRFVRPVRPGDTIHVVVEILELRPSASKPDRGLCNIRQTTYNQRDEAVLVLDTLLFLKRSPVATKTPG